MRGSWLRCSTEPSLPPLSTRSSLFAEDVASGVTASSISEGDMPVDGTHTVTTLMMNPHVVSRKV